MYKLLTDLTKYYGSSNIDFGYFSKYWIHSPLNNPAINDFTAPFMQPELNPLYNPYLSPWGNHPLLLPFVQPVWSWAAHNLPEVVANPMSYPSMTGLLAPNNPLDPMYFFDQQMMMSPFSPIYGGFRQWQKQLFPVLSSQLSWVYPSYSVWNHLWHEWQKFNINKLNYVL